eukprot:3120884-Amphidinium_carterae.1
MVLTPDAIVLHQRAFTRELIHKYFGRFGGKGRNTTAEPVSFGVPEKRDVPSAVALKEMQGILGSILWVSTRTRPDLCYAHSLAASSLTQSESETKLRLSHILQYLTRHDDLGLRCPFEDESLDDEVVMSFGDASFAPRGKFSQTGLAIFWGSDSPSGCKSIISWQSQKQTLLAESSA